MVNSPFQKFRQGVIVLPDFSGRKAGKVWSMPEALMTSQGPLRL